MQVQVAMGCVIAVGNQKGGVGKTTVAVHLAAALGERGYRCLLIDLDPAAGATRHLGVAENAYAGSLELLSSQESLASLVLAENLPTGVHLVPSRPQLSELDTVLSKFVDRTRVLDRPLAVARDLYDYIILDTPPAAGAITTVAAYAASEWFILSAFPHPLSVRGISEACADIADVRERRNPELEVLGIVFTNVDGRARRMRAEIDGTIGDLMPGRRFRTVIGQAVAVPESSGRGQTVFQHPDTQRLAVARQFRRLADEVEHRTHNREVYLGGTLGLPPLWLDEPPLFIADDLSKSS